MYLALSLIGLALALIVHEAGHAYEMRKKGIEIAEAGLGLPIPGLPQFRFRIGNMKTVFTLNLLLLGAYVKPSNVGQAKMEALPYQERALIYGAGVLWNILFTLFLTVVLVFIVRADLSFGEKLVRAGLFSLGFILLWRFRHLFCAYIVPVVGVLATGGLIYILVIYQTAGVVGPVGFGKVLHATMQSWTLVLKFSARFSLLVGISNMIPMYPADGGRIADMIIARFGERARSVFRTVGVILVLLSLLLCIFGDFINPIK